MRTTTALVTSATLCLSAVFAVSPPAVGATTDGLTSAPAVASRLDADQPTSLALTTSARKVTFGEKVGLSAQLTGGTSESTVSVYGKEVDHRQVLVAKSTVGTDGVLEVTVQPEANVSYIAKYAGELGWAASTSDPVSVSVAGRWTARSIGGYATKGQYRLYHWTKACDSRSYRRCPAERFVLTPSHAGTKVRVTFQWWNGRRWDSYFRPLWSLGRNSDIRCWTYYDSRKIIGERYRVSVTFPGDRSHTHSHSDWVYWRVTR